MTTVRIWDEYIDDVDTFVEYCKNQCEVRNTCKARKYNNRTEVINASIHSFIRGGWPDCYDGDET